MKQTQYPHDITTRIKYFPDIERWSGEIIEFNGLVATGKTKEIVYQKLLKLLYIHMLLNKTNKKI